MKNIKDAFVGNKTVLLRVDYNVPLKDSVVQDVSRIEGSLPTIHDLQERGAKIILISHLGRPKGDPKKEYSLKPVYAVLQRLVQKGTVHFCDSLEAEDIQASLASVNAGDILLLENIRFDAREEANDASFAKMLASFGDIFVNDAFSASHRAHASVEGITRYMPAYAGYQLLHEIDSLEKYLLSPETPFWAIVGGAKISTKLPLVKRLLDIADGVFVGGAMASTLLKSQGYNVGKSLVEDHLMPECESLIKMAQEKKRTLLWPSDVVVADSPESDSFRTISISDLHENDMILDVGEDTLRTLKRHLKGVQTIVWNGPLGLIEVAPYDKGTQGMGSILSQLDAIKVAGGGDTVSILKKLNLIEAFHYVSLAGGAFLEWLEGRELPGLKALQ